MNTLPPARPDGPAPLILTGSSQYLSTCSLVLQAVRIPHDYDREASRLSVPDPFARQALYHLDTYFVENRGWPEAPPPAKRLTTTGNPPTILMIGALVIFYLVTGPWESRSIWFQTGAINSAAIRDSGQWWRLVTALTLHADLVHLLGNSIIGGFLVHLLNRTVGAGLSFFLLITCGTLGNLLNILARDQLHLSVGFSTSIFAAIGIFSGIRAVAGRRPALRDILAPLGAGAGLLAMLGVSGERTDLGAHLFGFACGIAAGLLLSRLDTEGLAADNRIQAVLFALTAIIILVCWNLAFDQAAGVIL